MTITARPKSAQAVRGVVGPLPPPRRAVEHHAHDALQRQRRPAKSVPDETFAGVEIAIEEAAVEIVRRGDGALADRGRRAVETPMLMAPPTEPRLRRVVRYLSFGWL